MVKDQRPDLATCSDPVTAAMIEAPTPSSFFEDGSDGRACARASGIEQNAENPFTITCSATARSPCTTPMPATSVFKPLLLIMLVFILENRPFRTSQNPPQGDFRVCLRRRGPHDCPLQP